MDLRVSNNNERKEFNNQEVNRSYCNKIVKLAQNINESPREIDRENKMSNHPENMNQLYMQQSNSRINNNIKNYNQNYLSQSNEFSNGDARSYNDVNNINQGLNNIVRKDLKSRGIVNLNSSPFQQNRAREVERKAEILQNIKQQINLDKKNKMDELENKKIEDDKYLYAMENSYPFGK